MNDALNTGQAAADLTVLGRGLRAVKGLGSRVFGPNMPDHVDLDARIYGNYLSDQGVTSVVGATAYQNATEYKGLAR